MCLECGACVDWRGGVRASGRGAYEEAERRGHARHLLSKRTAHKTIAGNHAAGEGGRENEGHCWVCVGLVELSCTVAWTFRRKARGSIALPVPALSLNYETGAEARCKTAVRLVKPTLESASFSEPILENGWLAPSRLGKSAKSLGAARRLSEKWRFQAGKCAGWKSIFSSDIGKWLAGWSDAFSNTRCLTVVVSAV